MNSLQSLDKEIAELKANIPNQNEGQVTKKMFNENVYKLSQIQ